MLFPVEHKGGSCNQNKGNKKLNTQFFPLQVASLMPCCALPRCWEENEISVEFINGALDGEGGCGLGELRSTREQSSSPAEPLGLAEIFAAGLSRRRSLEASLALSQCLEKEWELNAQKAKADMKGAFVCKEALQFAIC